MKEVEFGEPTSFLDHVYLGCTQRECERSKDVVHNDRNMFESRISAGAEEKPPCSGKHDADISSWSYDMEGHAKKCVERYCELANKTTQQLYTVSTPCLDDHHFKEEEMKSVGELSKVCSRNDIANWQAKQLNSYTTSQHHALMTINSKKKMDQLENCPRFARRWF